VPVMDFTLGERQQAVADLAAEVLGADRPRAADPWKELARAGLLDVSPPDGLGVLEVAVLLTEIGKRVPSMQALATLMTGALPLARWGRPDLLPGVASGEFLLTAALREPPQGPATSVTDGTITGLKIGVPYADQSRLLLVPARTDSMIMNSSGHIAPQTVHDHESSAAASPSAAAACSAASMKRLRVASISASAARRSAHASMRTSLPGSSAL
jgi:alkylation response protein AidB-like acyl-CoA dehydrogenase